MAQELPILSTTSLANTEDDLNISGNGNYARDTNNERDQYVGLWEYNQNVILFQLKITKQDQVLNKRVFDGILSKYSYCDEAVLRYKLVRNGVVLFDNLTTGMVENVTNFGVKKASYNFLYGRILDHSLNVVGSYTIKSIVNQPPKIFFDLERFNYTLLNDPSYYQDNQPLLVYQWEVLR